MQVQIQSLNQWLKYYGYVWVEGNEEINKAQIDANTARNQIYTLLAKGAIKHE